MQTITMYQGEDLDQDVTVWQDAQQTNPLIFTHPVMDLRSSDGSLLARFDSSGTSTGTATVVSDGVLGLTMAYRDTAAIPGGTYAVDVFADVGSSRKAIVRRGSLTVKVLARITQDTGP